MPFSEDLAKTLKLRKSIVGSDTLSFTLATLHQPNICEISQASYNVLEHGRQHTPSQHTASTKED